MTNAEAAERSIEARTHADSLFAATFEPSRIVSVEIVKPASAIAQYGSLGVSGALLVTFR